MSLVYSIDTVEAQSFYKDSRGLFSTRPSETQSLTNIKRFGPVGMGIDLIQPAFTMRISHIEESSPAAKTGKLKTGQIIESINRSLRCFAFRHNWKSLKSSLRS